MANRRLANSLAKKLVELDRKIDREFIWNEKTDRWEAQKLELVKEAQQKINLVSVGVADGSAIYWETNRTTRLVTFEWLYGGEDRYIDDWGPDVSVPIKQAARMIKNFRSEHAL